MYYMQMVKEIATNTDIKMGVIVQKSRGEKIIMPITVIIYMQKVGIQERGNARLRGIQIITEPMILDIEMAVEVQKGDILKIDNDIGIIEVIVMAGKMEIESAYIILDMIEISID